MKGAINIGGVKDLSESPLRVLSGPPKCELIGEKDITYNLDVTYFTSNSGILGIQLNDIFPATGISEIDPPKPYPYGKWVLDITYTSLFPIIPVPIKFGLAQIVNYDGRQNIGHAADFISQFLLANAYSHAVLTQPGSPDHAAHFYDSWFINGTAPSLQFNGPDLFSFLMMDFTTSVAKTVILPEQLNYCDSYFIPFIFAPQTIGQDPRWTPLSNQFGQIAPQSVQTLRIGGGQYPSGTKIGTLQFRFRRTATLPLFTYSTAPPLAVAFNNRTFFNPSLGLTWDWDFGDGSAHSTAQNPTHNYPATGTYHVILRATDPVETKAFDQLVNFPLKADFSYTGFPLVSGGVPVREVHFTNLSLGNLTNDWDFGDGSPHSSLAAPVHEYPRGQSFNVTLTVGDGSGKTNTVTKPVVT